ncbi:MAG: hypothetical protein JJU13_21055 [Balneolaceae bacterium]|nr:hypothetical protein [Balneolaceae bacterium]
MPDYRTIRNHCQQIQQLTSTVIDDFLIYFAAQQDKLNRQAEKQLARYRHISKHLPESWKNMSISQYIAHKMFKQGGLINKYINHSGLSHLSKEERTFLEFQKQHPWRFSFAKITGEPETDFFNMHDVFTGDSYLLYSPGMTDIRIAQNPRFWFNLISFNGQCWQTFGPIGAYSGFESQDILFYATELNQGQWFESGRELMANVEKNPVPYFYLISGANLPQSFHKEDQIVHIVAEYLDDAFDAAAFGDKFKVEYSREVYKLSLMGWDQFPHFTSAYYDEKEELLVLYSMTDRGFRELVNRLNECGYQLSYEPDIRVNIIMIETIKNILKKEIKLNRYDHLFYTESPNKESGELKKINAMITSMLPYINSGNKPDLDALAKQHGVDSEMAKDLYEQVMGQVEESRK